MGTCPPAAAPALRRADRRRRLEPVHLRHLNVHQHRVEAAPAPRVSSSASTASRPLAATVTAWPRFSSRRTARRWFTALSSASNRRSGRGDGGSKAPSSGADGARPAQRRPVQRRHDRVQQLRLLDRLGQARRHAQFPALRRLPLTPRRREHHQRRPRQAGPLPDLFGQAEAVHLRHHRVQQHQRERVARRQRALHLRQRRPRALGHRRPHAPVGEHFLQDAPVGRVVVHHQHRQAPQRGQVRQAVPVRRLRRDGAWTPSRAVKWKTLPAPTSLSTHSRPPIRDTSCTEIVSPSPVPPYLRVVDVSACVNASKIASAGPQGCRSPCPAPRSAAERLLPPARPPGSRPPPPRPAP